MLTDLAVRKAALKAKPYKLSNSKGLYMLVSPNGTKSWRYKFRFGGKEKLLTLGLYPDVKLADARLKHEAARALLRAGQDPSARASARLADAPSLEEVSRDWYNRKRDQWSRQHAADTIKSLETAVFPSLGSRPIDTVGVADVLAALRKIEKRGTIETAHRVRQRLEAIFAFAIASGLVTSNPGANVKGALTPMPTSRRQPAIVDLDEARVMLTDALAVPAQPVTRLAVLLLALTAVRPGELRYAEWSEIDLDAAEPLWTIPAARMKGDLGRKSGEPHIVPLAPAAVECLTQLRALTGAGKLLFASIRHAHKPMSENAIGYLLNRAGYHGRQTAHGFRATFSTIMNERFPADRAIIDLMLAHTPQGASGSETAYNRALHMPRRRQLAIEWAKLIMDRGAAH